jgi:hypothetical protein
MVDFEKLINQSPMTEEQRQKLWDDWYNGLPESEKRKVDKIRKEMVKYARPTNIGKCHTDH